MSSNNGRYNPDMEKLAINAERALLGNILLTNEKEFYDAAEIVEDKHFYLPDHATMWKALTEIVGEEQSVRDLRLLLSKLQQAGSVYWDERKITDLSAWAFDTETPEPHAVTIRRCYYHREEFRVSNGLMRELAQGKSLDYSADTVSVASRQLQELHERSQGIAAPTMGEVAVKARAALLADGHIETGFPQIDRFRWGPVIGNLTIIAARTSHGKTSMAINIVANVLKRGGSVVYYTMETSDVELFNRFASYRSGMSINEMRDNPTAPSIELAYGEIAKWPLSIFFRCEPIGNILAVVRARHVRSPICLFVVDYLQRYGDDPKILNPIINALARFATKENIAVMALSQITKTHTRGGAVDTGRPLLASTKGSTTIGEASAMVWILWRPERDGQMEMKTRDGFKVSTKGKAELIVAKNTTGPVGECVMNFNERCFQFWDPFTEGVRSCPTLPTSSESPETP